MKLNIQLFAVPFRRTSKTKKRMRKKKKKKEVGAITTCPKCGASLRPHRACSKCGYYKNQDVLHLKKEEN